MQAFSPPEQTIPHPPQFPGSKEMLVQTPLHLVAPAGQSPLHVPLTQVIPAGQTFPQAPQLALLLARLTQELPHFVSPGKQALLLHVPLTQFDPAAQTFPQAPQLALSEERLVQ